MSFSLLLTVLLSFASQAEALYGRADAEGLRAHCRQASDTTQELLCRYRLYPLTQDETLLDDLPDEPETPNARDLALRSGLYGYRAGRSALPGMIRNGRRAVAYLEQAEALDRDEPFVLLVGGQSLVFRPKVFGGDVAAAQHWFERLGRAVAARPDAGVGRVEAAVWHWYTLHRRDDPEAPALRRRLLADDPPPLYADFLRNPPS